MKVTGSLRIVIAALAALPVAAAAQQPDAIMVAGETLVATIHAQGAQVYECKADASGALAWQFREPVATLLSNGKTLGRHYAGPIWEFADGSAVAAKVAASAPGASQSDIPLLKLAVVSQTGERHARRHRLDPAAEHQGRRRQGTVRRGRRFPQRAVFGRLRVLQEELIRPLRRVGRSRRVG